MFLDALIPDIKAKLVLLEALSGVRVRFGDSGDILSPALSPPASNVSPGQKPNGDSRDSGDTSPLFKLAPHAAWTGRGLEGFVTVVTAPYQPSHIHHGPDLRM